MLATVWWGRWDDNPEHNDARKSRKELPYVVRSGYPSRGGGRYVGSKVQRRVGSTLSYFVDRKL